MFFSLQFHALVSLHRMQQLHSMEIGKSVATLLDEATQPSKRVPLLHVQDFFRFQLKQIKRTIQSMHGDAIT